MLVGHRVVDPGEVGRWGAEIVQISLYRGARDNLDLMRRCVRACQEAGVPYVLHPVSYPLLDPGALEELAVMAQGAGLAMILHDERAPAGGRLEGPLEAAFRRAVRQLSLSARISFENAINTADAHWFWERFAESVTLDIGHMEGAGLDSAAFVGSLSDGVIGKVRFVHMHRNGEFRGGLTDHWPLTEGCREVEALRRLLRRKRDISVILEINEREHTAESLAILRALREEAASP